jgi:hypothetical protein
VRVCLAACVYRVTFEYSGQYPCKVGVYHVKQLTSLNDVQSSTELRVIRVVAAQTCGS